MQDEYDFSNGERGKFYNKDATFQLPVYLDEEIQNFITLLAKKQKKNISEVVNALLIKDKELMEVMQAG